MSVDIEKDMERLKRLASMPLDIATAPRRTAKVWKNSIVSWNWILDKLENPIRTGETTAEYKAMKKSERDARKDQGGFVGGLLKDGIRKKGNVLRRQIVCLDADNIPAGLDFPARCAEVFFREGVNARYMAYALYSTHSSTKEKPRFRLVIPLLEPIKEEEYEPIARYIANQIGMDAFDPTTYNAERLMYFPSCPKDGEYFFYGQKGCFTSPDVIKDLIGDWRDASRWPVAKTETVARARTLKKLGDPREKPGLIGAFCRAYTITEAIEKFLPGVYAKVDNAENRYTYTGGSTTGGMIVYDDGLHAYSHHATDPISGQDVNAFDLVRLHLYSEQDEDTDEDTPVNKRPSYVAMTSLAQRDEKVKGELNAELKAALSDELLEDNAEEATQEDLEWVNRLQRQKGGKIIPSAYNFLLILENDPRLKAMAGFNEFSGRVEVLRDLPWRKHRGGTLDVWRDEDDAQLRNFVSLKYEGLQGKNLLDDALVEVTRKNSFHPVRDYFKSLHWDKKKRLERLLIDYLGAEDAAWVREITVKFFKAAVARIYHPGQKFDQCLVLTGPQGIGKSTLLARMGGRWYQDTMPTIKGKDAMESLQGYLIIEMSEMQGPTRAENDELKAFISRQSDKFRAPYGRRTEEHPRQCVFAATTNDRVFLKDRTGGRRFWVVDCTHGKKSAYSDLTEEVVGQVWAEAIARYKEDKSIYPTRETEEKLAELVESHTEGAEKLGLIQAFLDMKLPLQWEDWGINERRDYFDGTMEYRPDGVDVRERVCTMEIWCECLGNSPKNLRNVDARELNTIMLRMPGWKVCENNQGRTMFKLYGRQRAYVRVESSKDEHGKDGTEGGKNGTDLTAKFF